MIARKLSKKLRELAASYPVVVVTGPRQSGKTTLCQSCFPDHAYVSLESLDNREFAAADPRGFLAQHPDGAVLDEIQHAPQLMSYLQSDVDSNPLHGRYVLTGSQHFSLSQAITQSLAGRCGALTLLAPDYEELQQFQNAPRTLPEVLFQGAYPRIYDREIPAGQWLRDYTTTYIERDVRQITNVGDLQRFTAFLRLIAGRVATELNLSSIGNDSGITHNTARSWLGILETSHLVARLPAWHRNVNKQVIKAPKLHFLDSGLVCSLLGIRTADQVMQHPLRGAIFESWVYSELYKSQLNIGLPRPMYFYRESRGLEVDVLIDCDDYLQVIEIKSGATLNTDYFANFAKVPERLADTSLPSVIQDILVYGGDQQQTRQNIKVLPWSRASRIS
ncbi:MAG: ATP-binding protein [Pseudohongiellaceae bacterium]